MAEGMSKAKARRQGGTPGLGSGMRYRAEVRDWEGWRFVGQLGGFDIWVCATRADPEEPNRTWPIRLYYDDGLRIVLSADLNKAWASKLLPDKTVLRGFLTAFAPEVKLRVSP